MTTEELKEQRRKAAHRQRRIIFNDDGEAAGLSEDQTMEEYLAACVAQDRYRAFRFTGDVDTQVDSYFLCVGSTDRGPGERPDPPRMQDSQNLWFSAPEGELPRSIDKLTRYYLEATREAGMEIFASFRMNDPHDAWQPRLSYPLKVQRPDLMVGTRDNLPPHGYWSELDYAQPEVRRHFHDYILGYCRQYDYDGLELDFFRQLTCFKSAAWGQPVTEEERDMMTELLQQIREGTEQIGRQRGWPMLVSVRVADCPEFSRALGLDWEQWLQEDLIDLLIVGGYFQLRPWRQTVELGHKYDVPVYPCLSESRMEMPHWGPAFRARNSPEGYRARAMNVWNSGADGVYLFNFNYYFTPEHPLWRELGDPQILQGTAKVYHASVMGLGHDSVDHYLPGGWRYVEVPLVSPDHIAGAWKEEPLQVEFEVGEDVMWGTEEGIVPRITLRLQILNLYREKLTSPYNVEVKLNGRLLDGGCISEEWVEYALDPELVKQGTNELEIAPDRAYDISCVVHDVELQVSYEPSLGS